jgi:hypothetical protein
MKIIIPQKYVNLNEINLKLNSHYKIFFNIFTTFAKPKFLHERTSCIMLYLITYISIQ